MNKRMLLTVGQGIIITVYLILINFYIAFAAVNVWRGNLPLGALIVQLIGSWHVMKLVWKVTSSWFDWFKTE